MCKFDHIKMVKSKSYSAHFDETKYFFFIFWFLSKKILFFFIQLEIDWNQSLIQIDMISTDRIQSLCNAKLSSASLAIFRKNILKFSNWSNSSRQVQFNIGFSAVRIPTMQSLLL